MDPRWRDSSGSLIRGGVLQVQGAMATSKSAPSLAVPLSKVLAAPLLPGSAGAVRSLASSRSSRSKALSMYRSSSLEDPAGTLRERVASTRTLSDKLKGECLERLDRIHASLPPNLCRRPSWSHTDLDPAMSGSPSEWGDRAQDIQQALAAAAAAAPHEGEISDLQHSHGHWPPSLAPLDGRSGVGMTNEASWSHESSGGVANMDRSDHDPRQARATADAGIIESANHSAQQSRREGGGMLELLDFNHPCHQWTCSAKKLPRRIEDPSSGGTVSQAPDPVPVFATRPDELHEASVDSALTATFVPRGAKSMLRTSLRSALFGTQQ